MFTWIIRIVWLVLSALLLVRIAESLFGVDQTTSILPIPSITGSVDVFFIVGGVAWGILLTFGVLVGAGRPRRRRSARGPQQLAPATVIETRRTGMTINEVPQYEIFLDVQPVEGEAFVSSFRQVLSAPEVIHVQPRGMLPVLFRPGDPDHVALADPSTHGVEQMMLRWRIAHGLVADELISARTRGISQPASVLALRPTGAQREGQVQITTRLLITPADGSAAFEADSTVFVHPDALSHVQVGSPVFAMYEPAHPERVHMTIQRQEGLA
ncbi:MAG: hypothetical protein ACTHVH_00525 [Microbacterium gubbeenense]|uniref:hypothetical protein n=1 Tax=Microbacterium gubbeenense TaxID=159896 RepID=UPI003F98EF20